MQWVKLFISFLPATVGLPSTIDLRLAFLFNGYSDEEGKLCSIGSTHVLLFGLYSARNSQLRRRARSCRAAHRYQLARSGQALSQPARIGACVRSYRYRLSKPTGYLLPAIPRALACNCATAILGPRLSKDELRWLTVSPLAFLFQTHQFQ